LVWDEKPLFRAQIEAWANGPVVRSLYDVGGGVNVGWNGRFEIRMVRHG